jgi:prolyl-tRNA synthetase
MTAIKNAITPTRNQNFAEWYQEVIKAADLAEHSVVRGCMIIKPWGYAVWESIQKILDKMIKETGHQNAYFPLLIPLSFLEKEAAHVEGFAKECAIVTHYRLESDGHGKLIPSPDAVLSEPLIIRPTSETIIGNAMAKWVCSYNDLPVLLNQWCNVVRWEMRTRLFLRTTEFLWQEGHTAHATQEEAVFETLKMLDVYERLAKDYLAIPVIKGEKTTSERFPGAVNTYCIEAMMQDGKALQAGTSHFLGQNFSQAYGIRFTDEQQQLSYAWTTSWGSTTRLIGALIMTHSDDDGLVLPPAIAPEQVILLPVIMNEEDRVRIITYCEELAQELRKLSYLDESLRVAIDKTNRRGGEKFWGAVKKGIPIRIEIGKREIESGVFPISRRDKPAKEKNSNSREEILSTISDVLVDIQHQLYERALKFRQDNTREVNSFSELRELFSVDENSQNKFAVAYFDPLIDEDPNFIKNLKELKLTTRCIPFEEYDEGICIFSGNKTNKKVILARAY